MEAVNRYVDAGESLYEFADEFLVVCPRCQGCGLVRPLKAQERGVFAAWRLICPACGVNKEKTLRIFTPVPGKDWYFQLPLWLADRCAEGELWAFNWRHLNHIEGYVRATLRERRRDVASGWNNKSALNRLPPWIKSAKNRSSVLRGIARIRKRAG